jgi:hypothetical protein
VMDRDQGVRIFTPAEAFAQVVQDFEGFRDDIRFMAHQAGGESNRDLRAALVLVVKRFDLLEEGVRLRFDAESRMGPDRPELADDPVPVQSQWGLL